MVGEEGYSNCRSSGAASTRLRCSVGLAVLLKMFASQLHQLL